MRLARREYRIARKRGGPKMPMATKNHVVYPPHIFHDTAHVRPQDICHHFYFYSFIFLAFTH